MMMILMTLLAAAAPEPALGRLLPETPGTPGCVADVRRDGVPVALRATGLANLETGTPLTADTVFEIGSVSKQFIGAGVALLAERRRLGLDDPIRRWLPELPPLYRDVTIRMLLTHTSGIRSWNNLAELTGNGEDGTGYDNGWVLRAVARQRGLNNAPGAEYLYSNSNFVLAAIVIERASGETLNAFFTHAFFDRFGMTRTRWRTDFRAIVPGRAQAYAPADGPGWRLDMPFNDVAGAGGLLSTVGDLQRWNAMLAAPGARDRGWVAAIQTPGRLADGTATRYGFGLELDPVAGMDAVSHAGSTASYRAWLGRLPARRLSVALLCNSGAVNTEDLGPEVAALFVPAVAAAAVAAVPAERQPAAAPADATGLYRNAANDTAIRVRSDTTGLHFNDGPGFRAAGPDRLVSADGRRTAVLRRHAGGVVAIALSRIGNAPVTMLRTAPWRPSIAQLRALEGRFASPDVDGVQIIAVRAGKLSWRDPGGGVHELTPTYRDAFEAEGTGWTLRFVHGGGSGGRRLLFSITRARRLPFRRIGPVEPRGTGAR